MKNTSFFHDPKTHKCTVLGLNYILHWIVISQIFLVILCWFLSLVLNKVVLGNIIYENAKGLPLYHKMVVICLWLQDNVTGQ